MTTSAIFQIYDGETWSYNGEQPNITMTSAPSLAGFVAPDGAELLVCVYQSTGRALRWTTFSDGGWSPADQPVSNAESYSGVALTTFRGQLYCFYQGTDSHGGQTGVLKYVSYDGSQWSPEAVVPNAPAMSEWPAAVVFVDPTAPASDMLYCLYQGAKDNGHLTGVTYNGSTWAPLQTNGAPGMSRAPSAVVYRGNLVCLYQNKGADGNLNGASMDATGTWTPLVPGGKPVAIPGVKGKLITGSPAAAVWTSTDEYELAGQAPVEAQEDWLLILMQAGGNTGQLRCLGYNGAAWQLQMTLNASMPHETSPALAAAKDYLFALYGGAIDPHASATLPFALGDQDRYLRLPLDVMQPDITAAAQGGQALTTWLSTGTGQRAAFFDWLNAEGDAAWMEIYDRINNATYLVAVQSGATSSDNCALILSAQLSSDVATAPDSQQQDRSWALSDDRIAVDRAGVDLPMVHGLLEALRPATGATTASNASSSPPQPPSSFVINGTTYHLTGTITASFVVNNRMAWLVHVPLGVSQLAIPTLAKFAWTTLLRPLYTVVAQGLARLAAAVRLALTAAMEGAGGTSYLALELQEITVPSEALALDVGAAEGAAALTTMSVVTGGAALVGVAVILGTAYVVEMYVLHDTFHSLKVCNLTPYDVQWDIPYINQGHGSVQVSPVIAAGSTTPAKNIPAIHTESFNANGQTLTAPVFREADFSVVSGSAKNGVQYVMTFTFTEPTTGAVVGTSSVLFDMPFAGDNSLFAQVDASPTAPTTQASQSFYAKQSGVLKQLTCSATGQLSDGRKLTVTASYDRLSGKQTPPNQPGSAPVYWYNSLITLVV